MGKIELERTQNKFYDCLNEKAKESVNKAHVLEQADDILNRILKEEKTDV